MFFKKQWVTCLTDGRRVRRKLSIILPRELGFDWQGRFYMSRWFPKIKGRSPKERQIEPRDASKEKVWIPYPDGLESILRGVTLAIADGNYRLPTIEEIQKLCEEFREVLQFVRNVRDISKFRKPLIESAAILKKARKQELKEAYGQIVLTLPFRDKRGRFNIGVFRARMTATIDRLIERLNGIYSWLPHFAGRQTALENLRQKTIAMIAQLNNNLKAGLVIWPTELDFLLKIRPFTEWAKLTIIDLKRARRLMSQGKLADAQKIVNRVLQAIKVAGVLIRINQLLEEMDFDLLQKRKRPAYYGRKLTVIGNRLKSIDETGFKRPVCRKALTILRQAYRSLDDLSKTKELIKTSGQVLAGH